MKSKHQRPPFTACDEARIIHIAIPLVVNDPAAAVNVPMHYCEAVHVVTRRDIFVQNLLVHRFQTERLINGSFNPSNYFLNLSV